MTEPVNVDDLLKQVAELEQFGYIVSHDLQAPLRSLDSLVQWLEEDAEGTLNESSKGHLEMIKSQVTKLNSLFSAVLHHNRIGRMQIEPHTVDLSQTIHEICVELDIGERVDVNGELPTIKFNRLRAKELFEAILHNANKYAKPGSRIQLDVTEDVDFYHFAIKNAGENIPEKHLDRIFEIFQTLGRAKDGIGAGLAISKKIVEYHKGSIQVVSENGITIFQFSLKKQLVCI